MTNSRAEREPIYTVGVRPRCRPWARRLLARVRLEIRARSRQHRDLCLPAMPSNQWLKR